MNVKLFDLPQYRGGGEQKNPLAESKFREGGKNCPLRLLTAAGARAAKAKPPIAPAAPPQPQTQS